MATYTAVLVAPDGLDQDSVIEMLERIGVVAFCGPGSLVQDVDDDGRVADEQPQSVSLSMGGRSAIVSLEMTPDGPLLQLRGKGCNLEGETPGSYYLVAQ